MGTIAARDCLRVLELTEQVAAALVLATRQALLLRRRQGELDTTVLGPALHAFLEHALPEFQLLEEDRRLDHTLQSTMSAIRAQAWPLYN
jgi:histidine ammonia-lyase